MSLKHFGTDGIRGRYGSEALNHAIAFRAGLAAAIAARETYDVDRPRLLVGRDTRASGPSLLAALAAGFGSGGGELISMGVAPTPAVAKAVSVESGIHFGCSLTASHNPASDNGIKFFQADGSKPSEELEQRLDQLVFEAEAPSGVAFQAVTDTQLQLVDDYMDALVDSFRADALRGISVGLDCSNGAMYAVAPSVFSRLGASVSVVAACPNGSNINDGVGSEHTANFARALPAMGVDLGIAFDGDGDRLVVLDSDGQKLAGEAVLGMLAVDAKQRGRLGQDTLVTTIQSNLGLDAALGEQGIAVKRVGIGDKFVARAMKEGAFTVGGEESGHVVLRNFSLSGDGLFAALNVASLSGDSASLNERSQFYRPFPQRVEAVRVLQKRPLEDCAHLIAAISVLESRLGETGRVLVRYSGTEPKLRLLVEGKTDELVANAMETLLAAAVADLEVV